MLFLKKGWSPVPARIRRCCCGNNGRTQTRAPFHTVRGKTFIPCPSSAVAEPNVTDLFKFLTLWTSGNNIYYCLTFANVTCQRQTQNQFPRPFRAVTIEGTRNFVANSFLVPYIFFSLCASVENVMCLWGLLRDISGLYHLLSNFESDGIIVRVGFANRCCILGCFYRKIKRPIGSLVTQYFASEKRVF